MFLQVFLVFFVCSKALTCTCENPKKKCAVVIDEAISWTPINAEASIAALAARGIPSVYLDSRELDNYYKHGIVADFAYTDMYLRFFLHDTMPVLFENLKNHM